MDLDWQIEEGSVSGFHCIFAWDNNLQSWTIYEDKDKPSRFGTFIALKTKD